MAGIYIHIPFCKTRCAYCDFYSNTSMQIKSDYITALKKEISFRKDELNQQEITTLYFGGGTPSQLDISDWKEIFDHLHSCFDLSKATEIALEANPEDLTEEYILNLSQLPFNRISIGIQSFLDSDLKSLNRRHNSERAIQSVKKCKALGFDNISIDLMYGLPGQSLEQWKENLEIALSLGIQHISSYHLIYEEGTALYHQLKKGKIKPIDEDLSLEMFQTLIQTLKDAGFIHYEISNFALPGYFSKHNSSYWKGITYLGLGPSAHSFDGINRYYNPSNIKDYISSPIDRTSEILSIDEQYNDLILTSLRTYWGLDLNEVKTKFGNDKYNYCLEMAKQHIDSKNVFLENNTLKISEEGIFISDSIMSDLMYISDDDQ